MKIKVINLTPGVTLWFGAGLVVLAPAIAPALGTASKTLAKALLISAIRTYLMFKATSLAAIDVMADLYEEAKDELSETEGKETPYR